MKNAVSLDTKSKCFRCKRTGFFSYDGKFMSCPRCLCETNHKCMIKHNDGVMIKSLFCDKCGIVFEPFGCEHRDDVYNSHLICKYKYNDDIYDGMPVFESLDELIQELNNIVVLQLYCPNNAISSCCSDDVDYTCKLKY